MKVCFQELDRRGNGVTTYACAPTHPCRSHSLSGADDDNEEESNRVSVAMASSSAWNGAIIFRLENGDESALDEVFPRQMHDLSFHMSGDRGALRFDGPVYRKLLQLTNGSEAESHVFFLQTYPPECFSASPGFGMLQPRTSQRISVSILYGVDKHVLEGTRTYLHGDIYDRSTFGQISKVRA